MYSAINEPNLKHFKTNYFTCRFPYRSHILILFTKCYFIFRQNEVRGSNTGQDEGKFDLLGGHSLY